MKLKPLQTMLILFAAAFFLTAGNAFAKGRTDKPAIAAEEPQPGRAELIIKALAAAYPRQIEQVEFRNDDWALLIEGIWYYYADGKILPEYLLDKAAEYSGSLGIPYYENELPPWKEPTPEQAENFRAGSIRYSSSSNDPRPPRSNHLHEALWQMRNQSESAGRVKTITFLGKRVTVHSAIAEMLAQIENNITSAAGTDPQLQTWINGIGEIHGWNWRNVPGSESRSYHSYGVAIDILPKTLGGKETYWLWAIERRGDWWNIPYENRYHPPQAVIKAFEAYGFMWGGKWTYFDTMHFEYRPEVFIVNGLK